MTNLSSAQRPWMTWTGRGLTLLVVAVMCGSTAMKLSGSADAQAMLTGKFGYPAAALRLLGCIEGACALIYAVPATAPWGAVLMTGYLGGAVATHLRIGEPLLPPMIIGVLAWTALTLRRADLRAIFFGRRGGAG